MFPTALRWLLYSVSFIWQIDLRIRILTLIVFVLSCVHWLGDWYCLSVALVAFTNWYCAESVLQKSAGTPTEPTVDRYLPEIPLTWNLTTGFYSIRGVFRTLTCLIWFSIGSDRNFLDFSTSAATCFIVDNFRLRNRIGASSSFILSFWNLRFRLFTY